MFNKIRPLIFKLDPELAHSLAIKALKTNLFLKQKISEEMSKVTGGFNLPGFKWPL